jgi:mannose-6-phosphate isomerase-like protein (cupin superfamily)
MNLIAPFLWLALLFQATAQSPVPIEKEPRHHLEFANRYVRVFHVLIAPRDTTLFHTHINDGVGIKLTDAQIRDEELGGKAAESTVRRGDVNFTRYPNHLSHRVINVGSTPFGNMFVEVLPPISMTSKARSPSNVAGQTLELDNDRVRVFRLVLAPGQSIEVRQPEFRGVRVVISGGKVAIKGQSKKIRTVSLKPGDYEWFGTGMRHTLHNLGSSSFEVVDIELK